MVLKKVLIFSILFFGFILTINSVYATDYNPGDTVNIHYSAYSGPGPSTLNIYVSGSKICEINVDGSSWGSGTCNYVASSIGNFIISSDCVPISPEIYTPETNCVDNVAYDSSSNSGSFNVVSPPPACSYSSYYSCSGSTRTKLYSSSPTGCVGTAPADSGSTTTCSYQCSSDGINCNSGAYGSVCLSNLQCSSGLTCSLNICKLDVGASCSDTNQCASGLYCKTSTGKCTDPNTEFYSTCSNNQCVLVQGSLASSCTINLDCAPACSYSSYYSCSGSTRTKLYSSSPAGCVGTAPADSGSTTTCSYQCSSDGINCNSGAYGSICLSNLQCSSGLECRSGTCNYPICTSFTYSSWSVCNYGSQTRTVLTQSPANCVGGSPTLSQICSGVYGNSCSLEAHCSPELTCSLNICKLDVGASCSDTNQCASGLYCKTSTGKCTDPNTEFYSTCSNNQCVLVNGVEPNSCSLDVNCQACTSFDYTYGVCSNGFRTKTSTAGYPTGCIWTSSTVLEACKGVEGNSCTQTSQCSDNMQCYNKKCTSDLCAGVTCNAPPNNQCYVAAGACLSGACSYQTLPEGTVCGTDQVCTSGGFCGTVQPITSVSWKDLQGNIISSGNESDFFRVNVEGNGIAGRNVEFKLMRDEIIDSEVETKTSNTGSAIFQINRTGTYYFEALVESSPASSVKSSDLQVYEFDNSIPEIILTSPKEFGVYFVDSPIPLSATVSDIDDPIYSVIWNFGNGEYFSGSSGSYTFTSEGKKSINLRVTDERGVYSEKNIEISVLGLGIKVNPVIQYPKINQAVLNDSYVLLFNGTDSFVLNITNNGVCDYKADCLAGLCPNVIENSPSCSAGQTITVTNTPRTYSNLEFNWTFKEGSKVIGSIKEVGKTSGYFMFGDYGTKNITLKLTYNPTKSNLSSSSEFYLFNQRQCNSQGNIWSEIENGFIIKTYNTLNTGYCAGLDGDIDTGDDCCPAGFRCSINGCILDEQADNGCSSYTTIDSCNLDSAQRVKSDVLWSGKECGKIIDGKAVSCSCVWESNSCKLKTNKMNSDLTGELVDCSYNYEISQCLNGYQTVNINAEGNNLLDLECISSSPIIPCGKPVVALPFFGMLQLLFSIVGVYIIYFIFSRFVSLK